MKDITKEDVEKFINTIPLQIHYCGDQIAVVGVRYGFCKEANEAWGRNTVMRILDLLEDNKEYQKLLINQLKIK